jgi:small multidrug resistance pump
MWAAGIGFGCLRETGCYSDRSVYVAIRFLGDQNLSYLYLAGAIIAEVVATTALKSSAEFTKLGPSIVVVVGYAVAFYLLSLVLRTIPLGVAYALWSGLGIVLVTIAGTIMYKQIPDAAAILGMALIIAGAVIIHLFSNAVAH